ncbi:uncharacterized protein LOC132032609 isoform X2 [Lycium ferocissimum]|uniref:uncharacterized protein LOC132032609 isoform X2 n=1 Tax=Lycium ferocissimum TaxID=112874 RepID=UPI00281543CF|nr:uncharacterized protein LOC132032609 isoform X2 [Lycium ferocissimum]
MSPFMPNYSSAGSSARSSVPIKFEKKHPFVEHPINAPVDTAYFQEYENWLKKDLLLRHDKKDKENHYRKNKELVDPEDVDMSLKLGATLVKDKNWFYLLSMEGKLWNDEHLDVIFYYLRKKGKNEDNSTYKYTTVSCILHTIITEIYHAWKNPELSTSVTSKESDVCVYINGYRLMGNVPWHIVDNVLIPVNVKEENHWILVVISFIDRCLYVYDSYRVIGGHDAVVRREVNMLATLVPHHLQMSGFYEKKKDIDFQNHPAYKNRALNDDFDVVNVDDLPQQPPGSMDCGVYVMTFL